MPRVKNNTRQYLFKNKLNIRRKSKRELLKESFFMMLFGWLLLIINYFIPQKNELSLYPLKRISLIFLVIYWKFYSTL